MTAVRTASPSPASGPDGRPRQPLALVAAAVVAAATVAGVLLFGVVHPPELATFDDPGFGGALAVAAWDERWCITVVDRDGARELRCDEEGDDLVAWSDEGIEVLRWLPHGEQRVTFDPATGEEVAREDVSERASDGTWWPEADLGPVAPHDGTLEVRVDGEVVWRVEARDPYEVTAGWVSPDGAWVALQDSAERLLLVPADGSAPPAVAAEDVPAYATLVWRASPAP